MIKKKINFKKINNKKIYYNNYIKKYIKIREIEYKQVKFNYKLTKQKIFIIISHLLCKKFLINHFFNFNIKNLIQLIYGLNNNLNKNKIYQNIKYKNIKFIYNLKYIILIIQKKIIISNCLYNIYNKYTYYYKKILISNNNINYEFLIEYYINIKK